ncbi:hypothetical protein [Paenibacillus whitsoniae]|uniref:Uncharacterized protein n=1 Tax=Paenibacillus whitsoniae TaxID=2496558 RepID=A0A3S0C6G9_9BACL|nr:hypothetical protein [Paenibacillus whitsoniae]RTE02983.1 hypothetical protein EJQ19_28510 [Paenibacillus whitsoniae]
MAGFISVLALAAGAYWLEAPRMLRNKQMKEFVVFMTLLLTATALDCAMSLKVKLPNPFELMDAIMHWK